MTVVRFCRLFAIIAALSVATGTPAFAREPSAGKVQVEVRLLVTYRNGATRAMAASTSGDLAVGQADTVGTYGDFNGAGGAGAWPVGETSEYAWRVEARLASITIDTVELALNWERYRPRVSRQTPESGDQRVVKLMTGQRHLLDFVQSTEPASPIANLAIEVAAQQIVDPAFAGIGVAYDLWFVYESRSGQKTTRRTQIAGPQGEWKEFRFPPLGFSLDGTVGVPGSGAPVWTEIGGELLGRWRRDGTIGLAIRTRFGIGCRGLGASHSGEGVKELVAREGETISLELPIVNGAWTVTAPTVRPALPSAGVTPVDGGYRIASGEFFGGDRFSLLVTARRRQ